MHPNITIAVRAVRKAGDIIVRALDRLSSLDVQEKQANDYVTDIDLKAEQAIIDILHTAYPTDSFLTEEQGEIWHEDQEAIWVIDPIDGTLNFLHGFPHFAVSIAKKVKGRVELGVIFNPVTQDMFTVVRGEGATLNDRRIRVSQRTGLHGALVASNMPRAGDRSDLYAKLMEKIVPKVGAVRRTGSSALDLAYVAAGYLDTFVCNHFQEWDVAAGILLVREAGGVVTDLQGGDAILQTGGLVASNIKLIKQFVNW